MIAPVEPPVDSIDQPPACPVCDQTGFDLLFNKKGRDFWRCKGCDTELQHPLPTELELATYYDQSFNDGMYKEFTSASSMKQMTAQRRLLELSRHVANQGRWMDVGCADGTFVEAANAIKGVDCTGIELSDHAVAQATARGLDVTQGMIGGLPDEESYDAITAFDVIEHVLDPVGFLRDAIRRLRPGGHLVLTLPDTGANVRKLMGRRWYFYIPEEHLHYFNRQNLSQLVTREGLELTSVARTFKPLTYDYSLTQFAEFNPWIYRILRGGGRLLPKTLRNKVFSLPIGEMMLIARKPLL